MFLQLLIAATSATVTATAWIAARLSTTCSLRNFNANQTQTWNHFLDFDACHFFATAAVSRANSLRTTNFFANANQLQTLACAAVLASVTSINGTATITGSYRWSIAATSAIR